MANEFDDETGFDGNAALEASAALERSAERFSATVVRGLKDAVVEGKRLDTVLAQAARSLSSSVLKSALSGLGQQLVGQLGGVGGEVLSAGAASAAHAAGNLMPFAEGGVIGTPTRFPLVDGRTGLAGEAGPEAILPLSRGPDGRLGVAAGGGGAVQVTFNITTQDADSFRRSEAQVTAMLARAVGRGRRGS
ncbi:phage tail tape measure protein [Amorphus sp. 3PC139-8]|uniref:phage tail tape measure protein n=1 Tax=Amorphus sp. 3PC139-8 TaxID=2735676 RepID=UPI00345D4225